MKTITLPDELNLNPSSPMTIFDYKNTKEVSRQQIVLNKNTFSFLRDGTKEVYFDNSSYAIDNTQFLLMRSGHCLMTEKVSNESKEYRSILFFFSDEEALAFIRKFELEKPTFKTYYATYSFCYDTFIDRFAQSLLDISRLSGAFQEKILRSKFEEIMLYLIELKGMDFLHSMVSNSDGHNQRFMQTMESNQLNRLTLQELSFLSNMSVSTFKREFKKHFNSSPSRWFQEKRLEHAAFLLKNTSKRPSDIFEEVGYESLSTFIQAFKAKFGVTPKQYPPD